MAELRRLAPLALLLVLGCEPQRPSEPTTGVSPRALTLSPPLDLDDTQRPVVIGYGAPTVQNDGQNFIVGWTAQRGVLNQLYTTRVSPTGVVLDPLGVRGARGTRPPSSFSFAVGDGYQLTAWGEQTAAGTNIKGALGAPGQPPYLPRVDVLPAQPTVSMYVAWDGAGFGLSMPRGQNPSVTFVRVLLDGGTSAPSALTAPWPYGVNVLGMASTNGLVGIASYQNSNMGYYSQTFHVVDPATGAAVATTDLGPGTAISMVVGGDPRGFTLEHRAQVSNQNHIIIQRVTTTGALLNDAGSDVTPSLSATAYAVASLPDGNLLYGIQATVGNQSVPGLLEVTEDGGTFTPVSTFFSMDGGSSNGSSVSCIGSICLMGYESANPALRVTGVLYSPDAGGGAPFPLDSSARPQWNPKAAFAAGRYLAVWQEAVPYGTEYYGRLMDACGAAVSPPFLIAAPASFVNTQPHGSYAFTRVGERFLVVYPRYPALMLSARFIEPDAGVSSEFDLPVGTNLNALNEIAAESEGAAALVVWVVLSNGSYKINAARVAEDGTISQPLPTLANAGNYQGPMLALSRGEQGFQLLWSDFSAGFNNGRLRTVSLSLDGGVGSTFTFPLTLLQDNSRFEPLLGFDGVHHSATWLDSTLEPPALRLMQFDEDGGIVADGGELLGTIRAANLSGGVSCTEGRCLALYSELDGGVYRLRGLELSSDGGRQSFGGELDSVLDDEFSPAVAFGDAGALLTWSRYRPAPFGAMRAAARMIEGGCAASVDAGVDGGVVADGGAVDAGETFADAGSAADGGTLSRLHATVGCDCGAAPAAPMLLALFVASLLRASRRSHRRSEVGVSSAASASRGPGLRRRW